MIAVVVSSANRCYYCLVAHGQAVRQLSAIRRWGAARDEKLPHGEAAAPAACDARFRHKADDPIR